MPNVSAASSPMVTTDALLAREHLKLSNEDLARIDPMITNFDPMDHCAVPHIKWVILSFPGVFSGIGEFTVHMKIVPNKITGDALQAISQYQAPADAADKTAS